LICSFANLGAPAEIDLIFVLDAGENGEKLAKCLLQVAEQFRFRGLRVALEELPAMEVHTPMAM
jgi:hypothetical protein